jgi:hypothetical protein
MSNEMEEIGLFRKKISGRKSVGALIPDILY